MYRGRNYGKQTKIQSLKLSQFFQYGCRVSHFTGCKNSGLRSPARCLHESTALSDRNIAFRMPELSGPVGIESDKIHTRYLLLVYKLLYFV